MSTGDALRELLSEAGYSVGTLGTPSGEVPTFENETILGFVLQYPDSASMIASWREDSTRVLKAAQFALRRSDTKAWNVYLLLLTDVAGDYGETIALGAIEEDLVGTRKIARAGVSSAEDLRSALLPLLPVQNAPRLEAIDMASEISLRTTELPNELVEAFLSGGSETTLIQLLEGGQ